MTRSPLQILLVDDDETNIARLEQALLPLEQVILTAGSGAAALDVMARQSNALGFPGIVVTDLKMPEMSGLDLLRLVVGRDSDVPVIIVSAYGEIAAAVEAMRSGAYDFMERPVSVDDLRSKVKRALEKRALVLDNRALRGELANRSGLPMRLIGNSPAMEKLRGEIASIAMTDATVLIHGQTGTGKEVVARAIHDLSPRSKARFVAINCGALSENLIDSELFGHEAGAFTDAKQRRIGLVEYAKGGTLFLDEIESMPLALQVKLLRMLQERTIHRVGGNEEIKVDVRLVAATKTDLLEAASRREFREDLYFRLGVAELFIPPLNERREDIPLLFTHFLQDFANSYGRDAPRLAREELERLMAHNWRGNVRELRNFAERHVLGLGGKLDGDGLKRRPLPEQMDTVEAAFIQAALAESRGNVQAAADALGVPRRTLSEKMQRLGLARKSFE
ncbi:MAG: sigma-54-dependent transcriptional regulator [Aestuariivirga sp.]